MKELKIPDDPDMSGIEQLFTEEDVLRINRLSKSTLIRLMKAGEFPQPIRISARSRRWRRSDVVTWQESL